MEDKKKFLINSSLLYKLLIDQTTNNCVRRFLAFKIIVNSMSYEDLVNNRQFPDVREIRDIFLAHKQNHQFSDAFNAAELIKGKTITDLINLMVANLSSQTGYEYFPELTDNTTSTAYKNLSGQILKLFVEEFYVGYKLSNNFLCTGEGQIKEVSSNKMSGVFYRYYSSKELSILANFFITNLAAHTDFPNALQNFKIDYILHAVNMKDCIFKDTFNTHSIDGLLEVMTESGIGNGDRLRQLNADTAFQAKYSEMRHIRNKLAGHMDKTIPLADLLKLVDDFDIVTAYDFVNKLDKAIYDTAETHIVIQHHYHTFNLPIEGKDIIAITNHQNSDYFS